MRCVLHSGEGSEIIAPRDPTDGTPPLVRVHWPLRATTAAANHHPVVAAAIVCIIAVRCSFGTIQGGRPTMTSDLKAFLLSVGGLLAVAGSGLLMLWAVLR